MWWETKLILKVFTSICDSPALVSVPTGWLTSASRTTGGAIAPGRAWALPIWMLIGLLWWGGKGTVLLLMMWNVSVKIWLNSLDRLYLLQRSNWTISKRFSQLNCDLKSFWQKSFCCRGGSSFDAGELFTPNSFQLFNSVEVRQTKL